MQTLPEEITSTIFALISPVDVFMTRFACWIFPRWQPEIAESASATQWSWLRLQRLTHSHHAIIPACLYKDYSLLTPLLKTCKSSDVITLDTTSAMNALIRAGNINQFRAMSERGAAVPRDVLFTADVPIITWLLRIDQLRDVLLDDDSFIAMIKIGYYPHGYIPRDLDRVVIAAMKSRWTKVMSRFL